MNATLTQININRNNAKRLRAAGFHAEADAYDATADELRDEINELDRRRIAAKHAAVNPDERNAYIDSLNRQYYPIDHCTEIEHAARLVDAKVKACEKSNQNGGQNASTN